MIVDTDTKISISSDPLTFVLHPLATFEMVPFHESFITFLFVHLSVSARSLTYLVVKALTPFKPASEIDVQSLLRGLCCQPNNKADGISPPRT
ncbi:hypothetical protein [Okeania sp. SIO2B3]|uniref:hypothetical protein n=1 Tax=Okeania sp. SIO2B3 TaxID=2607784 RepID=UPI0013C22C5A|nr:hypothetical protein [Okeania sp. SIO2B3]NET41522.1 hypothetical protein [Okeania sp. SIO2B3]